MKKSFLLITLSISFLSFTQNQVATTSDGKKVILKSDKTWEYSNKTEEKRKLSLEFICKDIKKQFQVIYDAPDSNIINSGNQIGGFYNSGWKKSIYIDKMENQVTLKVISMGMGSETVTLNMYIDDKLVKTTTEKAKNILSPATLTINLEDYK